MTIKPSSTPAQGRRDVESPEHDRDEETVEGLGARDEGRGCW
jgi:hypothetical protein